MDKWKGGVCIPCLFLAFSLAWTKEGALHLAPMPHSLDSQVIPKWNSSSSVLPLARKEPLGILKSSLGLLFQSPAGHR